MNLLDYLNSTAERWFKTIKKSYAVQAMMVSVETDIYNFLEGSSYVAKPDNICVVLTGTVGEQWVTKLSNVIPTYSKADGSELTAEDFAVKDIPITIKTKAGTEEYLAMHIPLDIEVEVETSWMILFANSPKAPHGNGDYLVCRVYSNGNPDLSDVWVVNGTVFPNTYTKG